VASSFFFPPYLFSRRPRRIFFPAVSFRAGHAVSFFPPYLFAPATYLFSRHIFSREEMADGVTMTDARTPTSEHGRTMVDHGGQGQGASPRLLQITTY